MKLHITKLLVSAAALASLTLPALSDGNPTNVFSGGVGNSTSAVRLFMPTQSAPPVTRQSEREFIVIYEPRTSVRYVREHETRSERLKRTMGHRYPGFKKQYRGYKYPF